MFDALPLAELAQDLDLAETASPVEFLLAMVEDLEAETDEPWTGTIGGFPGAVGEISGTREETPYMGALAVIFVEDRVVSAFAMALPDQWSVFYQTFADMLRNVSFFEP